MPKITTTNKKLLELTSLHARELKSTTTNDTILIKDLSRIDLFSETGIQRQVELLEGTHKPADYRAYAMSMHTERYENIDGFRLLLRDSALPSKFANKEYQSVIQHYFNGHISLQRKESEVTVLSHSMRLTYPIIVSLVADLHDNHVPADQVTIYAPKDCIDYLQSSRQSVAFSSSRISSLIGKTLDTSLTTKYLENFGYNCVYNSAEDVYTANPPYYRSDVHSTHDVLEDLLSQLLHSIEPSDTFVVRGARPTPSAQTISSEFSRTLLSFGFKEVKLLELESTRKKSTSHSKYTLRSSLLRSLLRYETTNRNKKYPHKLFEVGNIFKENIRRENICILLTEDKADFNVLFSILFKACVDILDAPPSLKENQYEQYEEGASFSIRLKGQTIGTIGLVDQKLKRAYKIKKPCISAELYISQLV